MSLLGSANKSTVLPTFGDYLFHVKSSDVCISGLKIQGVLAIGTSFAVLNVISSSLERLRFENIDTWNLVNGFVDTGGSGIIVTMNIRNVMMRLHKGYGTYLGKAFAFLFMDNFTVDSVGVNNTCSKIVVSNNYGCYLSKVFLLGNTPGNVGQYGFNFYNCQAVHLSNTHADTLGGIAYYFNSCMYIQADHITSSLVNNHGLYLYNTKISQFTNVYVGGRVGASPAVGGANGIFLDAACDRVNISNYITRLNTGINYYSNPGNTNIVATGGIVV